MGRRTNWVNKSIEERLNDAYKIDVLTKCWNYTGNVNQDGYAKIFYCKKKLVHTQVIFPLVQGTY